MKHRIMSDQRLEQYAFLANSVGFFNAGTAIPPFSIGALCYTSAQSFVGKTMQRDLQLLLLVLAILAGCGAYVLTDGRDYEIAPGQSAISFSWNTSDPRPEGPTGEPIQSPPGGRCVDMRFLDDKGVVIPVEPPLVGIMIGDAPLFEGSPPPYAKTEPGRFVPCPDALVASVRKTFDDFCTTEDRRKNTAAANGVDIGLINKRCGDMTAALAK